MTVVAILISTYNGERYIKDQLDSIFNQNFQEFHVYIRDDGSLDSTCKVIEDYIIEYDLKDKITFWKGGNIGFCSSFFELLKKADDAQYWAFCDQDDVWLTDKLENAYNWMIANDKTKPLLYSSGFEIANEDLTIRKKYPRSDFDYRFYNSITCNLFFGFSMVINGVLRKMLLMADPKNVKYHDWFAAMITVAFGKYYLSEKTEAVHRQYSNNASPLLFIKKIPHGIKLILGDRFYNVQAREFLSLYGKYLSKKDRGILEWFSVERYSFPTACKKAFFKKRWNPQIKIEIVLRFLMLAGFI